MQRQQRQSRMTPLSKIPPKHALYSDVPMATVKMSVNRENINLLLFVEPQQITINSTFSFTFCCLGSVFLDFFSCCLQILLQTLPRILHSNILCFVWSKKPIITSKFYSKAKYNAVDRTFQDLPLTEGMQGHLSTILQIRVQNYSFHTANLQ